MERLKEYPSGELRNVVVLGHGGSGKTTLVDALAFASGASRRHGHVKEGSALTQYRHEELAHETSMYCTPAWARWLGIKVNLLDTPGYLDFSAEALAAARVADAAIVTVSSVGKVEAGTEQAWEYCNARRLPRLLFVSMMDRAGADFEGAWDEIRARLSDTVVPVEVPVGAGEDFSGILNLFSGKLHRYRAGTQTGEYDELEIPPELQDTFQRWRTEMVEAVAATDETLLERYLDAGEISRAEVVAGLKAAMSAGELVPLFCGAAEETWGMRALLTEVVELFPSPLEVAPELAADLEGEPVEVVCGDRGPAAALVFKTAEESHVGEISIFKVLRGSVQSGELLENANTGANEKLAHLSILQGKERIEVERLHAGDIGVVTRLKDTHTGDSLCAPGHGLHLQPPDVPPAESSVALRPLTRSDDDRLGPALARLHEEDPAFSYSIDGETGETLIRGPGELYLDVQIEKLAERYNVKVEGHAPSIHYRETVGQPAEGRGRHKRQTGGHGQFGDCSVRLRPLPRGEGYRFVSRIVGGAIPTKFVPSVDTGIQEAAKKGPIAGYPLIDFEAEAFDGSAHSVDSSDMAFKIAGSLALRVAVAEAAPVLLEPVMRVELRVPTEATGEVMGDISQRRGRVLGMDTEGAHSLIQGAVPERELYRYGTTLRALTRGRGRFHATFLGYEEAPEAVLKEVVAAQAEGGGHELRA